MTKVSHVLYYGINFNYYKFLGLPKYYSIIRELMVNILKFGHGDKCNNNYIHPPQVFNHSEKPQNNFELLHFSCELLHFPLNFFIQ